MKQTRWLTLALIGAFAQNPLSAAETLNDAAATAFPAVQEAGSARAVGMGSTYVGIAEGSASLPWNPAGLAGLCATEVALHHNSTVLGNFEDTVAMGMPLNARHGLGASLSYADNGDFEGRDAAGNVASTYGTRSFGASLGWGFRAPADISLGAALKVNRQDLADVGYSALAIDLGALWSPSDTLRVGIAYTNLGTDVAGYSLSQGFNLGVSSYLWKGSDSQWLLALSAEALTRSDSSFHAGAEWKLYQAFALRAGYGANATHPVGSEGTPGWTLGLGAEIGRFTVDYAFVPMAEIGNVQRVSLTYAFADCKQTR